eukprot:gene6473-1153_t
MLVWSVLLAAIPAVWCDYYDDLELPNKEESTEKEIKKAFRTLSKKFHPDHNPSPEARERYKLVSTAYEVLSDPRKRKIYDMRGEEGVQQLQEEVQRGNSHGNDPFSAFFGGGVTLLRVALACYFLQYPQTCRPFPLDAGCSDCLELDLGPIGYRLLVVWVLPRMAWDPSPSPSDRLHLDPVPSVRPLCPGSRSSTRGNNVKMSLKIPLSDIYNGNSHTCHPFPSSLCREENACPSYPHLRAPYYPAPSAAARRCRVSIEKQKGHSVQRVQIAPGFVQQMQHQCGHCDGTGKMVTQKCPACRGKKVYRGDSKLEVFVEKGIPEGHEVTFEMEADQSPDLLPGDVIFQIHTENHPTFKRRSNDLEMTMKISLLEALVPVRAQGVTPPGMRKKIKGEGMPKHNVPSEHGDLWITFEMSKKKAFGNFSAAEQHELQDRIVAAK